MGADGGSIIKRYELVPELDQKRSNISENNFSSKWTQCALSDENLADPIVSDAQGYLYNKISILKYLLGESPHKLPVNSTIKQIRDVVELVREKKHGKWVEPVTQKDIEQNGASIEFAYLAECGHISTWEILQKSKSCPTCAASFEHIIVLNPGREEAKAHNSARQKSLTMLGLSHSLRPKKLSARKRRIEEHAGTSKHLKKADQ